MTLYALSRRGDVVALTEELRAESLKHGCEPTCHFCDATIAVGEEFGFRVIRNSVLISEEGVVVPAIRAMGCAACVRSASEEQLARARKHADRPARTSLPRGGCLITDEGEFR